jgi:hypothetical protein
MDEPQGGRTSAREAAMARARRVKRWVVGGAVALTGVFSAVAAHALPASHSSKKATTSPAAPAAPPVDQSSDDQQQPVTPIAPPQQAPQPSASSGGAVSGAS